MDREYCPEIHYVAEEAGLTLTGCYGADGEIRLPDTLSGQPLTAIGAYAFAGESREPDGAIWLSGEAPLLSRRTRLAGAQVTALSLPAGIRSIGRYAFYQCRALKKLTLYDGLTAIGGGAFSGCYALRTVEIFLTQGKRSALPSIVSQVRYEMQATLHYPDGEARVLFPEHYEEAQENTPARILFTVHHGSGGDYRQCFYDRELDFHAYDELLPRAIAEEETGTVARLALNRLETPYALRASAKDAYLDFLSARIDQIGGCLVEAADLPGIRFLGQEGLWTDTALEAAIDVAAGLKEPGIVGELMQQRSVAGYEKKRFVL